VPHHHSASSFDSIARKCLRAHWSQYTFSRPFSIDVTQVSGTC
jgi:hypothetical protein